MPSLFGDVACFNQAPSNMSVTKSYPLSINPNRLVGPIKGLDYLTTQLPTELLLEVASYLVAFEDLVNLRTNTAALGALATTCRRLHRIFEPILYRYNTQYRSYEFFNSIELSLIRKHSPKPAALWAVTNNSIATLKKLVEYNRQSRSGDRDVINRVPLFTHITWFTDPDSNVVRGGMTALTPLQLAVMATGVTTNTVRALVELGADLDKKVEPQDGSLLEGLGFKTPLFMVTQFGNWEMVVTLLDLGASVHGGADDHYTLAYNIITGGPGGTIGPSKDFESFRGRALRMAIANHPEVNLDNSAVFPISPSSQTGGCTLLTTLVRRLNQDHDTIRMLEIVLELGADPNVREDRPDLPGGGTGPLGLAIEQWHGLQYSWGKTGSKTEKQLRDILYVLELLLKHGAVADDRGRKYGSIRNLYLFRPRLGRLDDRLHALELADLLWKYQSTAFTRPEALRRFERLREGMIHGLGPGVRQPQLAAYSGKN